MKKLNKKALLAGLITGICNGLFGAGGGMVAVFTLISLTGYEQARAHATAISVMLPLTAVSALVYVCNSAVDWTAVLYVAPSLTLGSIIGAKLTGKLSPKWLNRIFSALMLFAAVWMLFAPLREIMNWLIYIAFGLLSGVAAGMGMGGGTILIPALTLFISLDQHAAQGVNMLAFLPAAAAALLIHKKEGRLEVKECIPIILAGVVGALMGAFAAGYISSLWLRRLFGIFLIALSILQLVQGEKRAR